MKWEISRQNGTEMAFQKRNIMYNDMVNDINRAGNYKHFDIYRE